MYYRKRRIGFYPYIGKNNLGDSSYIDVGVKKFTPRFAT